MTIVTKRDLVSVTGSVSEAADDVLSLRDSGGDVTKDVDKTQMLFWGPTAPLRE